MSKTTQTTEQKKAAKATYDKARRASKKTAKHDPTGGMRVPTKAEVAADRAAVIAERAALKATAGKNGKPEVKAVAEQPAKEPKAVKTKKEPKERPLTVASMARDMIVAGNTDEQVFAHLVEEFQITDAKKSYPSWYRSQLVRKGIITKAFADEHRHDHTA